ncbi:MAG TPA: SMI1/KNR4 family protein [Ktedonobacterales bacterium]
MDAPAGPSTLASTRTRGIRGSNQEPGEHPQYHVAPGRSASYLRHNGGYKFAPVVPMRALPVAEILDTWQMLRELLDDEEWAAQPPYYFTEEVLRLGEQPGPIQPVWWHPRWIPLAMDNAGNLTCLDMAPAPGGVVGQIIDWDHECGPSRVLFPNFHHLLRAFSEQLEGASDKQST